jgi:hypothetical protein
MKNARRRHESALQLMKHHSMMCMYCMKIRPVAGVPEVSL